MKIFVIIFLIYLGYRLVVPKTEINIEQGKAKSIEDDEYTDYEEID